MAKIKFICQRLDDVSSLENIKKCFSINNLKSAIICVAFARYDGVYALFDCLKRIGKKTKVIVGINNNITSAQALACILETGAELYVVNTGNSVTFHPKLYYAFDSNEARVIMGSSNLTNSGLNSNIEFSSYSIFSMNNEDDKRAFNSLESSISYLLSNYGNNVFLVRTDKKINELLNQDLLENENIIIRTNKTKLAASPSGILQQDLPVMMKTMTKSFSHINPIFSKFKPRISTVTHQPIFASSDISDKYLLKWESNHLAERDLNIPKGRTTNPTGSMGMKKGNSDVDQRIYFRSDVFSQLDWANFETRSKVVQEETTANFRIIIQGVDKGSFKLRITHDPRTDTKSYEQNNMMTHLHWGTAKSIIANKDLLGKTMRLSISLTNPHNFLIEID